MKTQFTNSPQRGLWTPPDIPLDSSGGELLWLGRFNATVSHKVEDYPFTVYVVGGHQVNNLLCRTLSVRMNLGKWIDEIKPNTGRGRADFVS